MRHELGAAAVLMLATFAYAMRTRVHALMDPIWPLADYASRTSGFIPWPPR